MFEASTYVMAIIGCLASMAGIGTVAACVMLFWDDVLAWLTKGHKQIRSDGVEEGKRLLLDRMIDDSWWFTEFPHVQEAFFLYAKHQKEGKRVDQTRERLREMASAEGGEK